MKVRIINGPNLNLLGTREPEIYGHDTLHDVEQQCLQAGAELGYEVECLQSNHEGQLVEWIQQAIGSVDVIVINAAAYTHTSVAIHDALRAFSGYTVELHISNPHQREAFRHRSFVAPAANAIVAGLGVAAYADVIKLLPQLPVAT